MRPVRSAIAPALLALCVAAFVPPRQARAAEAAYPFEGTWVRANRACTAAAPLARTYAAREVTGANTHCTVRKVASGSGQFELFEECRRGERPGNYTETIRMTGSDAMVVRRQATRLKLARPLRFIRCSIAGPAGPKSAPPHRPTAAADAPVPARGAEDPAAPKPIEPAPPKP